MSCRPIQRTSADLGRPLSSPRARFFLSGARWHVRLDFDRGQARLSSRPGPERHCGCQGSVRRAARPADHLGFDERIRGGHHILTKTGVKEILDLEPKGRDAKTHQVKRVRAVTVDYRMAGGSDYQWMYEIIISWSDEDAAYVAEAPESPGCAAD